MSKNYIFRWQSVGDVHNIRVGFCKATKTSGLYNCQLEKVIACLYGPGKQGNTKILVVTGRTKEINETNLTQHFTSNFLIQFVYHEIFDENSFI